MAQAQAVEFVDLTQKVAVDARTLLRHLSAEARAGRIDLAARKWRPASELKVWHEPASTAPPLLECLLCGREDTETQIRMRISIIC